MCKCGRKHQDEQLTSGQQIMLEKEKNLRDLFQSRDALQILCDQGYKLQDILNDCNKEISDITDCI